MLVVNVAKDFTRFPSGRFKRNGETSGEAFRERFLEPPLREGKEVLVELDGTIGYGSSFLEEAFGGLVRSLKVAPSIVQSKVHVRSIDATLLEEVKEYISNAVPH
jgi:hypothetical protein